MTLDVEELVGLLRNSVAKNARDRAMAALISSISVQMVSDAGAALRRAFVGEERLFTLASGEGTPSLTRAFASQALLNRMAMRPPRAPEETTDFRTEAAAYRKVVEGSLSQIRDAAQSRAGRSVTLSDLQTLQQTAGQIRVGRDGAASVTVSPQAEAGLRSPSPTPSYSMASRRRW